DLHAVDGLRGGDEAADVELDVGQRPGRERRPLRLEGDLVEECQLRGQGRAEARLEDVTTADRPGLAARLRRHLLLPPYLRPRPVSAERARPCLGHTCGSAPTV